MIDSNYITPHINFLSSVILFGIIQGVIILTLFFIRKPKGYRLITIFFGLVVVHAIESFLWFSGYLIKVPHLISMSPPLVFFFGPILLLYTREIIDLPNGNRRKWLHFVPGILYALYTGFFYAQPVSRKLYYYLLNSVSNFSEPAPWQPFHADPLQIQGLFYIELMALSLIVYGLIGLKIAQPNKISKKANTSYRWLLILNCSLVISGVIMLLAEGGVIEDIRLYHPVLPLYMTKVYTTLSMYIIVTYLLFNKNIFKSEDKYQKSSLSKSLRAAKLEKIIAAFEEEKLHLRKDHSLRLLSEQTKMPENHISEVLNTELKLSFYDITNNYRIKEAKRLLEDDSVDMKVEHLAEAAGYKSKSAFYNAFKNELSMTPLQYKKSKRLS